jgi:hypothetical protein
MKNRFGSDWFLIVRFVRLLRLSAMLSSHRSSLQLQRFQKGDQRAFIFR